MGASLEEAEKTGASLEDGMTGTSLEDGTTGALNQETLARVQGEIFGKTKTYTEL